MKAVVLAATTGVASAAWDAEGSEMPARLNPQVVAGQSTRCFKPWGTGFMGTAGYDATCNATATGSSPVAGPDCLMTATGAMTAGSMFWSFGATAGAPGNAACCKGLIDMGIVALEQAGGWVVNVCQPDNCGNTTQTSGANFWAGAAPWDHTATNYPKNNFPSQAQFKASSLVVFGNGGQCWNTAKGEMAGMYMSSVNPNTTYPASLQGLVAGVVWPKFDNRLGSGDMNPRSPLVQFTNEERYCYFANRTNDPSCGSDATIKITGPNCVHVHSASRDLYFVYGPKVAALPGCCMGIRTALHIANRWQGPWVNTACDDYSATGAPACMAANTNATKAYWTPMHSGTDLRYPADGVGNLPNEAAFDAAMDAIVANDLACYNEIKNYTASNPTMALNAIVGGLLPGLVPMAGSKWPTTVAPTTAAPAAATEAPSSGGDATTAAASGGDATTAAASGGDADATTAAPKAEPKAEPKAGAKTSAKAKAEAKKVAASFTATETLPAGVTGAQLLASTPYKTAKKEGIAAALAVAKADITIVNFAVTAASRALLAQQQRALATASAEITTDYEVAAADAAAASAVQASLGAANIADTIKAKVNEKMAAATFAADGLFNGTAPTVTAVSAVTTGTVSSAAQAPAETSDAHFQAAAGVSALFAFAALF